MPFTERWPFFILVLLLSTLNNLAIPFVLYFRRFGRKGYSGRGGCNFWGVIMDGFLAGAINLIALNLIFEMKEDLLASDVLIVLAAGFLSMVAAHSVMSMKKWEVWIMPKPWQWNEGGYWHMFSMTVQMAFVYYPLWLILKNLSFLEEKAISLSLIAGFALAYLFLLCLEIGRRGLKIGQLTIGNQSW